jgi:hypothetical protein
VTVERTDDLPASELRPSVGVQDAPSRIAMASNSVVEGSTASRDFIRESIE